MPPVDPRELTEDELEYIYVAYLEVKNLTPAHAGRRRTMAALKGVLVKYGWAL